VEVGINFKGQKVLPPGKEPTELVGPHRRLALWRRGKPLSLAGN